MPPEGPPLLVACYDGRVEDVRKLLAAGADPRLPCGDQRISSVGMPMGPKAKRVNELVCECGGDLEEVARTDEETKELVREWISKISSYNGGARLGNDSD